jgi:quercetin dioxygenase-like cupin family protein
MTLLAAGRVAGMEHKTARGMDWAQSPSEHFAGEVWNSRLAESENGATVLAVQFAPGARTDWHSHPEGQVLYVVSGAGLVQSAGGPTVQIAAGDVVMAGPGERHWHGAGPGSPMMHLSVTTGGPTAWEERVSEDEGATT